MDPSATVGPAGANQEHLLAAALQARAGAAWAEEAAAAFAELRLDAAVESAAGKIIADHAQGFAAELRSFWRETSATLRGSPAARNHSA